MRPPSARCTRTGRAQTRLADGNTEDLAGVSLLRFDSDGLVTEHRDFWNAG